MSRFRTLLRVERVVDRAPAEGGLALEVCVPGWNPHRTVVLPVALLPAGMLEMIECSPGPSEALVHLHAVADLSAERGSELELSGPWQLDKGQVVEDASGESSVVTLSSVTWGSDGRLDD